MQIPVCDPKQEYLALQNEIEAAVQEVLTSGHYILGPHVTALEQEVASYCQCKFGVGVGNGTDALHLALRALGVGPGDEVITTPFTFIATTEAIGMVGAKPVFADIDPRTFNIDPNHIESAITDRTKLILPVHLYGQPCDMDAIMDIAGRYGLRVVEDCAQALGAEYRGRRVGTFGDIGCLSFFPSKNLGCIGDGGMVVTNDESIHDRVEYLRRHGGKVKYYHDELGLNSRLDALQAAILRVKLPHLDHWNSLRQKHAYRYNASFAELGQIACPVELTDSGNVTPTECCQVGDPNSEQVDRIRAVYHQYTLLVDDRDAMRNHLLQAETGCAVYYPIPLHLQRVHENLGHRRGDFPIAENVAEKCLSLPIFPSLSDEQIEIVTTNVRMSLHGDDAVGVRKSA